MEGIWKNENIMIHVGQNLFNYVFSTLAWFTASQIYSAAGRARGFTAEGRALTMDEAADQVLAAIRKFEEQKRRWEWLWRERREGVETTIQEISSSRQCDLLNNWRQLKRGPRDDLQDRNKKTWHYYELMCKRVHLSCRNNHVQINESQKFVFSCWCLYYLAVTSARGKCCEIRIRAPGMGVCYPSKKQNFPK